MTTQRILQNNLLLWIDDNIDENETHTQYNLERLREVVRHITVFTQIAACIEFLRRIDQEKVLIITSGSIGESLVQQIHSMPNIEAIYVFCSSVVQHVQWAKKWSKIRGVYDHMDPICEALRTAVKQIDEDLTPISFVQQESIESDFEVDLNRLEPSFMYTTLFKRVFIDMEREVDERDALIKLCRAQFAAKNFTDLKILNEFHRDYHPDRAIWWYTRQCFLYQMLNRALRLLESDVIVDMGFFIRDLHRQLEYLHHEQFDKYHDPPLTLYRGQCLPVNEFSRLKRSLGGLVSFNSFLSTTQDRSMAVSFARGTFNREDMVGIMFVMTVDPKMKSAAFANIQEHSYFAQEQEILFSMHTVFRIGEVIRLNETERVFEVELMLTRDDDPELRRLTDRMEQENQDNTSWHRVGRVLLQLGNMDKAEELYLSLLDKKPNERNQALYYHNLGQIKEQQGDYQRAIKYYEQALQIQERTFPDNHPDLATSYSNIGSVYSNMGEYSEALSCYKKALFIEEKSHVHHPHIAQSYNNIGTLYDNMGEYSQALHYFNKALGIKEKSLPANHPSLATSYNNVATVYHNMGEYSQALSYFNRALSIREKTLPANHPHIAQSYNNVGLVYDNMGEYAQALSYYSKALAIQETTLPANHPSSATSYNNLGAVYYHMREYSQALSYYSKALGIQEKTLPANHPSLATSYNNIGAVYYHMGEYSQALLHYHKALCIVEQTLPANHPDIAQSYNNLGGVYMNLGDNSQALSYYNKALAIREKTLPANHPHLATSYMCFGTIYYRLKEYSVALPYFQKALDIRNHALPAGHSNTKNAQEWVKKVQAYL